jgi:ligand-binding sensor domain-containing protein
MIYRKILHILVFVLGIITTGYVQNPPLSFHHLTVENGLNDGHIQMIGQDYFGYIWFGSLGALNRYDGRNIRTYAYRGGDTTSPLPGMAFSMMTDSAGGLYFGFENGMAKFDFLKDNFKRIKALQGVTVFRMIPYSKDALYLMTSKGLVKYNPLSNQAHFYSKTDSFLDIEMSEAVLKDNKLYIGTSSGIIVFDLKTEKTTKLNIPILNNVLINSLCFDDQNRLWVTAMVQPKVFRFSADFQSYENYDKQLTVFDPILAREYYIIKDKKNRIWISTKHIGLLQYLPESNSFTRYI